MGVAFALVLAPIALAHPGNWERHDFSASNAQNDDIVTDDFDGDEDDDALVANGTIYESVPEDPSDTATVLSWPAAEIAAGDLDEDGDTDVVRGATSGELYWYENTDGWTEHLIDDTAEIHDLAVGWFDGDTDRDIVLALADASDDVTWYENDGDGDFTARTDSGGGFVAVTEADIDNDLVDEVVGRQAGQSGAGPIVITNLDAGVDRTVAEESTATELAAADVNSDGFDGVLTPSTAYVSTGSLQWSAHSLGGDSDVAVQDVDSDGIREPVTTSQSADKISWWDYRTGEGFEEDLVASISNPAEVGKGDLNDDAAPDLVALGDEDDDRADEFGVSWFEIQTDRLG